MEAGSSDFEKPGRLFVWMLAIRPRTLSAAAAPVLVGTGFAAGRGVLLVLPATAALIGALLIQITTNLANDYYDFVRGGDTEKRVGPVRVTQAGLIAPASVRNGMFVTLGLALAVGVYLVWIGGWPVVVIGLASLACAVAYTGGPFPLAYHGLGDVFVFVFFGLVAVGGTYWVQALDFPADLLLAGAGVGALNTAILVANNLRDMESDAAVGKRTLAVRMGRTGSRIQYIGLVAGAFMVPLLGVALAGWPRTALLALASGVYVIGPMSLIMTTDEPSELIPALGGTARLVAAYGALLALGFALGA
ncbi:MAG: 1,4-dihydroxy-2-naphthoate polyprenyltransferase [Gemmatimonadota bacterium]|nr:MAG: 1,4-dihydroxy-2-naphthoate polyprenyltransferase [Gemmatimonadota bacterium]